MNEYRVTFGSQYPREPHPWPHAHRDGWLTIHAGDMDMARSLARGLLGLKWSDCYEVESLTSDEWFSWFPLGELARITYEVTE